MSLEETHLIPSPCIRQCTLNDKDICLGCGRSLLEILHWNETMPAEQEKLLVIAEQRLKTIKSFIQKGGAQ